MGESMFDKAADFVKEQATEHKEQVDEGIEKVADFVDEKTGGKYSDQIEAAGDQAAKSLKSFLDADSDSER